MFEIIEDKTLQEVQAKSISDITDAMFKINPVMRLAKTEVRHEHRLTVADRRACEQAFIHTADEMQTAITEIAEFDARVNALVKQRDKLLAACKLVHGGKNHQSGCAICEAIEEVGLSL